MTRPRAIARIVITAFSAFGSLVVTTLWVWSYFKGRQIDLTVRQQLYTLRSERGSLTFSGPPTDSAPALAEAWKRVSALRNSDVHWVLNWAGASVPSYRLLPFSGFVSRTPAEERALLRALDDPGAFVVAHVALTIGRGISTAGKFEYPPDGSLFYEWAGLRLRCSADTWEVLDWRLLLRQLEQLQRSGARVSGYIPIGKGDTTWDADPTQMPALRAAWVRRLCTPRCRVPYWAIMVPLLLAPAHRGLSRWRVARRKKAGRCPACAYDLQGTLGHCPECGRGMAVAGPHRSLLRMGG